MVYADPLRRPRGKDMSFACKTLIFITAAAAVFGGGVGAASAGPAAGACRDSGHVGYVDPTTGQPFKNQGQCVSFVVKGGTLVQVQAPVLLEWLDPMPNYGADPGEYAVQWRVHPPEGGTLPPLGAVILRMGDGGTVGWVGDENGRLLNWEGYPLPILSDGSVSASWVGGDGADCRYSVVTRFVVYAPDRTRELASMDTPFPSHCVSYELP
jgi:hypothetical protein